MKANEFCYWLQGHFELNSSNELTLEQVQIIKNHLNMVFIHDIDKSYPKEQQQKLNEAHTGKPSPGDFIIGRFCKTL